MARTRKSSKSVPAVTGFTLGSWDNTFTAIADARNKSHPAAKKQYSVVVEKFEFSIHTVRAGKMSSKPAVTVEIPRTKAAVERVAAEWAARHPGKPFKVMYTGWFNGTNCLPRYNNPTQKGDRVERVVEFSLEVYNHTGEATAIKASPSEQAQQAMMAALDEQA